MSKRRYDEATDQYVDFDTPQARRVVPARRVHRMPVRPMWSGEPHRTQDGGFFEKDMM